MYIWKLYGIYYLGHNISHSDYIAIHILLRFSSEEEGFTGLWKYVQAALLARIDYLYFV